ncbi:unnamed protein product, partial [Phaeothamnion confervicola]
KGDFGAGRTGGGRHGGHDLGIRVFHPQLLSGWGASRDLAYGRIRSGSSCYREGVPESHHFLSSWHLWQNIKKYTAQWMRGESVLRDATKTAFRKAEYCLSEASFGTARGNLERLLVCKGRRRAMPACLRAADSASGVM